MNRQFENLLSSRNHATWMALTCLINLGCGGRGEADNADTDANTNPNGGASTHAGGSSQGATSKKTATFASGGGTVLGSSGASAIAGGSSPAVTATGGSLNRNIGGTNAATNSGGSNTTAFPGGSNNAGSRQSGGASGTPTLMGAAAGRVGTGVGGNVVGGGNGTTISNAGAATTSGGAAGQAGSGNPAGSGGTAGTTWVGGGNCAVGSPVLQGVAGSLNGAAMLGGSCGSWGALACNLAGTQSLVCSGQWALASACSAGEVCDLESGVCSAILAGCQNHAPGYSYCDGNVLRQCSLSGTSVHSYSCCGICTQGSCSAPACGDGQLDAGEQCDDGNVQSADGCDSDCKPSDVVSIAGGAAHTCALLRGGSVRCWGANDQGQLGLGNADNHATQQPYQLGSVALGGKAKAIAAGSNHTCALMDDASVQCWGANSSGQLGLGHLQNIGDTELPTAQVSKLSLQANVQSIAAGGDSTCALITDGTVRCWGRNNVGQLGLGHTTNVGGTQTPAAAVAQVALDATATAVGVSGEHACAALSSHVFRCWGHNQFGQLDDSATTSNIGDNELPTAAASIPFYSGKDGVNTVLGSGWRTFVLYTGGLTAGWGYNLDGALGAGSMDANYPSYSQRDVGFPQGSLQITGGRTHACMIRADRELFCWGLNDKGQLGAPDRFVIGDGPYIFPRIDLGLDSQQVPVYTLAVGAGEFHTCAWLTSHALRCWGYNASGQLGLGYVSSPPTDYVGGDEAHNATVNPTVKLFSK